MTKVLYTPHSLGGYYMDAANSLMDIGVWLSALSNQTADPERLAKALGKIRELEVLFRIYAIHEDTI